jgi:hypothetical protein
MSGGRLFWAVVVATLAVYAVMLGWSIPAISDAAGGRAVFDMLPAGYSYAEAQAFLAALSPEGADLYLRVQHRLDLIYPALLAISTGWAMVRLAPNWRWRSALLLAPIPGMVFDYLENRAVAAMLSAGADGLTPEMVAQASRYSQLKAIFSTLSLGLLLVLILAWTFRRWRARAR